MSRISSKNSYYEPLEEGEEWVGQIEDVSEFESITLNYESSNTPGVLTVQFSVNGYIFTDYNFDVTTNFIVNIPIVSKYMRVRFLNNSSSNQTFLRLQTSLKNAVSTVQISGNVNVEPGSAPLQVQEIVQSVAINNGSKPFEFIPTAYNLTPEIYVDGQLPNITPYGLWSYTNTNPQKINLYIYRTLKQTDLSLASIKTCYMTIQNLSDSLKYPYMAVYSLPSGTGDGQAWYKSKFVYENSETPINTGEKVLLYFGEDDVNIEPGIRHINMPLNSGKSDGPRNQFEQLMFVTIQTASGENTGAYNFEFSKFGINWSSYEDNVSAQKPQGVMIQNDLSELVVSNAPNPSIALKPYRNINVGLTASNIKLGPTWIHTINTSNDDNKHLFLKLYSSTTQPNENSTPIWTVRVHNNQSNDINFNVALYSDLGFWVRCSGGVADNNTVAPSTNGCICNIAYC
jgi:hypothetical protein